MSLSEGNPELRQISADFHWRGTDTTKDLPVRHFRTRTFPRFFFEPDAIASAIATIVAHYTGWREQVLSGAQDWCEKSGGAYLTSLTVNGAIGWQHLLMGPGRDHLHQDRVRLFASPLFTAGYGER